MLSAFRTCAAPIRSGALRLGGPDPNELHHLPRRSCPTALKQALAAKVVGNPLQYESQISAMSSFPESSRIVVNPQRDYRDMPLVVLTATVPPPLPPGTSPEPAAAAWYEHWNRAHDELAALSTRGVNARVPGATHDIQRHQAASRDRRGRGGGRRGARRRALDGLRSVGRPSAGALSRDLAHTLALHDGSSAMKSHASSGSPWRALSPLRPQRSDRNRLPRLRSIVRSRLRQHDGFGEAS